MLSYGPVSAMKFRAGVVALWRLVGSSHLQRLEKAREELANRDPDAPTEETCTRERAREFQAYVEWYVRRPNQSGPGEYGEFSIVPRSSRIEWLESNRDALQPKPMSKSLSFGIGIGNERIRPALKHKFTPKSRSRRRMLCLQRIHPQLIKPSAFTRSLPTDAWETCHHQSKPLSYPNSAALIVTRPPGAKPFLDEA